MEYAFNYTGLRATPVRTDGVVAKLMKVSKPKVFFIKPKFSYFYASYIYWLNSTIKFWQCILHRSNFQMGMNLLVNRA